MQRSSGRYGTGRVGISEIEPRLKDKAGATLIMTENPPALVGTGFTNCLPNFLAGVSSIPIGWHNLHADSLKRRRPAREVAIISARVSRRRNKESEVLLMLQGPVI